MLNGSIINVLYTYIVTKYWLQVNMFEMPVNSLGFLIDQYHDFT